MTTVVIGWCGSTNENVVVEDQEPRYYVPRWLSFKEFRPFRLHLKKSMIVI
jgi:hypothetical protein